MRTTPYLDQYTTTPDRRIQPDALNITLIEQLHHEMSCHDWYYMMSDDYRAYRAGKDAEQRWAYATANVPVLARMWADFIAHRDEAIEHRNDPTHITQHPRPDVNVYIHAYTNGLTVDDILTRNRNRKETK